MCRDGDFGSQYSHQSFSCLARIGARGEDYGQIFVTVTEDVRQLPTFWRQVHPKFSGVAIRPVFPILLENSRPVKVNFYGWLCYALRGVFVMIVNAINCVVDLGV